MSDFSLPGCGLEPGGLRSQRERYAELGRSVARAARAPLRLTVDFTPRVDVALVEAAIAVERDCCPFLVLDYDATARRLTAAVGDAMLEPALDALGFALGVTTP